MRFLADENFPGATVAVPAAMGHDVVWVRVAAPATGESGGSRVGGTEERTLLTFDKDFGQLARASPLPATSGVVPFRMPMPPPGAIGQRFACP